MRRAETSTGDFRQLLREISLLLAYEVTRSLPTELVDIDTPIAPMRAPALAGKKLCFVSVLRLKTRGCRSLKYVCLVAAPEGLAAFGAVHADVPIFTAAIDRKLDEHGYIVPGLGDAGDRLFGTK